MKTVEDRVRPARGRHGLWVLGAVVGSSALTYLATRHRMQAENEDNTLGAQTDTQAHHTEPASHISDRDLRALIARITRIEEQLSAGEHAPQSATAQHDAPSEDVPDEDSLSARRARTPVEVHASLEATWADEPTDQRWSRGEEKSIGSALADPSDRTTITRHIACRSSMCKVGLAFQDNEARARFEMQHLGRAPFDHGVFIHEDNAAGTEVSLYAMRDTPEPP